MSAWQDFGTSFDNRDHLHFSLVVGRQKGDEHRGLLVSPVKLDVASTVNILILLHYGMHANRHHVHAYFADMSLVQNHVVYTSNSRRSTIEHKPEI